MQAIPLQNISYLLWEGGEEGKVETEGSKTTPPWNVRSARKNSWIILISFFLSGKWKLYLHDLGEHLFPVVSVLHYTNTLACWLWQQMVPKTLCVCVCVYICCFSKLLVFLNGKVDLSSLEPAWLWISSLIYFYFFNSGSWFSDGLFGLRLQKMVGWSGLPVFLMWLLVLQVSCCSVKCCFTLCALVLFHSALP